MTDSALAWQTLPAGQTTFGGHPRALRTLFFTEMWERFSYYGMRALLVLYMTAPVANGGLGFDIPTAAGIYGWYTFSVYLAALPGGWLADNLLGQRRSVLIGGAIIAAGHVCLALHGLWLFYGGLSLIVCGTGLLKPNISSMVGGLYAEGDARRDAGFSIFYMGINLGAMIAPLACGFLAQDPSFLGWLSAHGFRAQDGWHFGFGAAAVGMTLGLLQFGAGLSNFGSVGRDPAPRAPTSGPGSAADRAAGGSLFTRDEWLRLAAIAVLFFFSALFWSAYEQAGSSLNLFADQVTDNVAFGHSFPSSWYQAINSVFLIALAPVFAWLWVWLAKREPSSPTKFAWGLLLVGVSFLIVSGGALVAQQGSGKVGPGWLVFVYLFSTLGELCLSPVGLSTVTKLAPPRIASLMMGVWFTSLALGNKLGGWVAGHFDPKGSLSGLFLKVALVELAAALLLFALVKPIRRLMAGVN